jgi:hypothetical protein
MEELAIVDVLESGHNLEQYALDTVCVHWLVVTGLHQLVEIAVHVLHRNVKAAAVRVKEDIQGGYEMRVWG